MAWKNVKSLKNNHVMYKRKIEAVLEDGRQAANTGNAKSLQTVLKHPEKYHVYSALKFGDYNVGRNGALLTLPFYMWYLLW